MCNCTTQDDLKAIKEAVERLMASVGKPADDDCSGVFIDGDGYIYRVDVDGRVGWWDCEIQQWMRVHRSRRVYQANITNGFWTKINWMPVNGGIINDDI